MPATPAQLWRPAFVVTLLCGLGAEFACDFFTFASVVLLGFAFDMGCSVQL